MIATSASFCSAFQIDPASTRGRKLSELGAGEWDIAQLNSLLHATASGFAEIEAYELDLVRKGQLPRRLVLDAYKLDDGNTAHTRLMLTVVDVTHVRSQERQKEELIRDRAIWQSCSRRFNIVLPTAFRSSPAC